jgi:hypothetical protein
MAAREIVKTKGRRFRHPFTDPWEDEMNSALSIRAEFR